MANNQPLDPVTFNNMPDVLAEMRDDVAVMKEFLSELKAKKIQDEDKFISPADACRLFEPAITKPTLSKLANDGVIVMTRLGGRTWYKRSDILNAGTTFKKHQRR